MERVVPAKVKSSGLVSISYFCAMISVHPGNSADVDTAAQLLTAARHKNPFDWACYPKCYSNTGEVTTNSQQAELHLLVAKRAMAFGQALQDTAQNRFFVAVDTDADGNTPSGNAIVGFVHWQILPNGVAESEWTSIMGEVSGLPPRDDLEMISSRS